MKQVMMGIVLIAIGCLSTTSYAQTYTVGMSGNYPTLNDAVTAYNSMVLTQPVTFLLTDAVYTTTTSIIITKNSTANSSNTLTIKPAPGINSNINGNVTTDGVIKIAGDFIIIDGSNNGSTIRNLTITNAAVLTPKVIMIGGAAQASVVNNITIKNTILINGINTSTALSISAPNSTTIPGHFNNITIENNNIQKSRTGIIVSAEVGPFQNGTGIRLLNNDLSTAGANALKTTGIFIIGLSFGCTIADNKIGNFEPTTSETIRGIWVSTACSSVVIKNNVISGLHATGSIGIRPIGIEINSAGGLDINVENNQVSDISAAGSASPAGIVVGTSGVNMTIQNNTISNIKNPNTTAGGANGIELNGSATTGMCRCFNNFVYDVAGFTSYGIACTTGAGVRQVVHNSILLNAPSGTSAGFYTAASVATASRIDCRNNIFANRSTPTATSFAIIQGSTVAIFSSIDNNNFVGTPLGRYGTTPLATLDEMKIQFGAASINIPPTFVSATDLHVAATGNEALDNKGTPVTGIITDIDGSPRSATTPDIGADEFGSSNGTALLISCSTPDNAFCGGATFNLNYNVQGIPGAGNIYTAQLSNSVGSFATPISIGTLASVATSGTISVTIPAGTSGSFYRIRVLSSSPAYTGTDNGTDITLQKPLTGNITGPATAIAGNAYGYSVPVRDGSSYAWAFSNGIQNTGGTTNSVTGTFNVAGIQQVSVTETSQAGCEGLTVLLAVTVTSDTYNWTGNVSTEWENAANWSGNLVPGTSSAVLIPAGRPRYPVVSINTSIKSISVQTGATVAVVTGVIMAITGN